MKLKTIVSQLEKIAPVSLAESWDNVGLLTGDPEQNIKTVLFTIDLTTAVYEEALSKKADLIIAYHPPLWEPMKKVIPNKGPTPLLYNLIRNRIAVYSFHTALDSVRGGINDLLADIVGLDSCDVLCPNETGTGDYLKLVVFTPEENLTAVSEAMFAAGAGHIGTDNTYSKCSFRTPGTGTFQCGDNSNPHIGKPGSFEQVAELRLETIVPKLLLPTVLNAMLAAHPYEEPAYDIIPLQSPPANTGLGRIGKLAKPIRADKLIETIKTKLKIKQIGLIGTDKKSVQTIAVFAGSCGTMLRAAIAQNADFFLTGELKHHHALECQAANMISVVTGHSNSERVILPNLARSLKKIFNTLTVHVSKKDHDPINWQ